MKMLLIFLILQLRSKVLSYDLFQGVYVATTGSMAPPPPPLALGEAASTTSPGAQGHVAAGGYSMQQAPHSLPLLLCNTCQFSTQCSKVIKHHVNRHRGIYPYYCPYCGKGVHATSNLRKHLRRWHGVVPPGQRCLHCREDVGGESVLEYIRHVTECPASREEAGNEVKLTGEKEED